MEEKSFLQKIKLESSRNFQLTPYERIAFYKIFNIVKSDRDKKILLDEIKNEGHAKTGALIALADFDDPELLPVLKGAIDEKSQPRELIAVLNYLKRLGSAEEIPFLLDFLDKIRWRDDLDSVILYLFYVLREIGEDDFSLHAFAKEEIDKIETPDVFRLGSFWVLSLFEDVDFFDKFITGSDDRTASFFFQAIYGFVLNLFENEDEENSLVRQGRYDDLMLKLRVLLGKWSLHFDSFEDKTKVDFIVALLVCNHRESHLFIMQLLESNKSDLTSMTLYAIYSNILYLRHPEKLFRSLLAINMAREEDSSLIAEIIVKYFRDNEQGQIDSIFREKFYSHISTTLESSFEIYRREFMIPEVMDKNFSEKFIKVRNFVLKYFNPEYKRKLDSLLYTKELEKTKSFIRDLAKQIHSVPREDEESLALFMEILLEEDQGLRENSAGRFDSLNFEKINLQSKIIRFCKIISGLNIESASSALVYIYNYLKKYPAKEIFEEVAFTLCRLNYSYMLSEVELMLSAGSPEEQEWAVHLFGLFSEKRLLNILVQYVSENAHIANEIVKQMVVVLSGQDVKKNINVVEAFRKIVKQNGDILTKKYAILGIGICDYPDDIDYLYGLYLKEDNSVLRQSIVKSINIIVSDNENFNKRKLTGYANEFLKDSGIKVRIYASILLLQLGETQALNYIRDMLIIKEKKVQRDLLSILREIHSIDFSFFLLSLIKKEYGITRDIIGILSTIPQEDLLEIDSFLINLFRKYEPHVLEELESATKTLNVEGLENVEKTILFLRDEKVSFSLRGLFSAEGLRRRLIVNAMFFPPIFENGGVISYKINNDLTVLFDNPENAVRASQEIQKRIVAFNNKVESSKTLFMRILLTTGNVDLLNDELFNFQEEEFLRVKSLPVFNRIIIDRATADKISEMFYFRAIPRIFASRGFLGNDFFEVLSQKNFLEKAMKFYEEQKREREEKESFERWIEGQVKNLSSANRSKTSIAIAGELEDLGMKLKVQFDEIDNYISENSRDGEMNRKVREMLKNVSDLYRIEISKLTIK